MLKLPVTTFQLLQNLLLSSRRTSLPTKKPFASNTWWEHLAILSRAALQAKHVGKVFWKDTIQGNNDTKSCFRVFWGKLCKSNSKFFMCSAIFQFQKWKHPDLQNLHQATDWQGPSPRHGGVPRLEPSRKGRCWVVHNINLTNFTQTCEK